MGNILMETAVKPCITCKHFAYNRCYRDAEDVVDLITGTKVVDPTTVYSCVAERNRSFVDYLFIAGLFKCGPKGKYWEPKVG